MKCDYCQTEHQEKDLGKHKDQRVCFKCATDRGIPADFEDFLAETPLSEEPKPGKAVTTVQKDPGNVTVTFLISALLAAACGYFWLHQFTTTGIKLNYLFIVQGVLSGVLVRLLQKGRGSNYQNIVSIMVMLSFLFPYMKLMQLNPDFDIMQCLKDFGWLIPGVFIPYFMLADFRPKKKE
ncbi:MAG: hypothetical protein RDV48_13880 [Candidatus Eremiobacteraeota bacterium]|nr:hypothetical protein [Candidatus Eremiobacteraeota bacterium]